MKNLLIYVNPDGFDKESKKLIKIQIDNSLELGWKSKDILLITDFPYEHNGIKAIQIREGFCDFKPHLSKVTVIVHLFETGLINERELYWCHDLDAFQLIPITKDELGLKSVDAGFTDYGRKKNWQLGSFFFKREAENIFQDIAERMAPGLDEDGRPRNDEYAMLHLTENNVNNINSKIKRLNNTYNFGTRKIKLCYDKAKKPLRVLHFHPNHPRNKGRDTLAIMMHGENDLGRPLMNKRLIKIFKKYGYT